jgi:hypothetical protein
MVKPGALPVDMGGGVFDNTPYNDSLAAQIESELNLLLAADGLQTLPLDNAQETRERRRLFVAIARGVIRHLRDNQNSIDVHVVAIPSTVHPVLNTTGI